MDLIANATVDTGERTMDLKYVNPFVMIAFMVIVLNLEYASEFVTITFIFFYLLLKIHCNLFTGAIFRLLGKVVRPLVSVISIPNVRV